LKNKFLVFIFLFLISFQLIAASDFNSVLKSCGLAANGQLAPRFYEVQGSIHDKITQILNSETVTSTENIIRVLNQSAVMNKGIRFLSEHSKPELIRMADYLIHQRLLTDELKDPKLWPFFKEPPSSGLPLNFAALPFTGQLIFYDQAKADGQPIHGISMGSFEYVGIPFIVLDFSGKLESAPKAGHYPGKLNFIPNYVNFEQIQKFSPMNDSEFDESAGKSFKKSYVGTQQIYRFQILRSVHGTYIQSPSFYGYPFKSAENPNIIYLQAVSPIDGLVPTLQIPVVAMPGLFLTMRPI
jgi:hypothetical protein